MNMRQTLRPTMFALIVACAALALPGAARADENNPAAIQLFEEGRKLMGEGKLAEACPKFVESQRLTAAVGTLLNLAKCYDSLGKTASAWTSYKSAVYLGKKLHDDRAQYAEEKAAELEPRLAKLVIKPSLDVPGLIVRLDGEDVSRELLGARMNVNPGKHVIEATAPGYEVWQTTVMVDAQAPREVTVPALVAKPATPALAPVVASPWGKQRIAGVAVGGVGVLGLIAGSVAGGLAMKKTSDAKATCTPGWRSCAEPGYSLQNDAKALAKVFDVAAAVGGAAVIAGVVMLATAPRGGATTAPPAGLVVGPVVGAAMTGVVVRGAF